MNDHDQSDESFDAPDVGLDDRSEELSDRTEKDAQIRFYRAMADRETDYDHQLTNLARTVAEVIFDFCVVYLIDPAGDELQAAAAYHPHRQTLQSIHDAFSPSRAGVCNGLVERVIDRRQEYFRPRWRPSLLQAYADGDEDPSRRELDVAIHSLLVVPMITSDDECLGALLVGRHTTTTSYEESDLALTEWIASHAAMKLETARLYRDLQRANADLDAAVQARDTFISIASHELRTPLSTLKLQSQLLRRTAHRTPEKITAEQLLPRLDSVDRQVDYLTGLIDQLLNVSRIMDGGLDVNFEPCELTAIVTTVAERFASTIEEAESELRVNCDDEIVGLWDRQRLDRIVTNLLSNAIKYGEGNPITLSVTKQADRAILKVCDNGRGIPKRARLKIFDRFERAVEDRRLKGLGLGLWIVREYLDSLHGTIEIESTVGEGSTFIVRLPTEPPADAS